MLYVRFHQVSASKNPFPSLPKFQDPLVLTISVARENKSYPVLRQISSTKVSCLAHRYSQSSSPSGMNNDSDDCGISMGTNHKSLISMPPVEDGLDIICILDRFIHHFAATCFKDTSNNDTCLFRAPLPYRHGPPTHWAPRTSPRRSSGLV